MAMVFNIMIPELKNNNNNKILVDYLCILGYLVVDFWVFDMD